MEEKQFPMDNPFSLVFDYQPSILLVDIKHDPKDAKAICDALEQVNKFIEFYFRIYIQNKPLQLKK